MTFNLRSSGQKSRHAEARRIKRDCKRLAEILARHEVALEEMVKEIRTVLEEIDEGQMARGQIRLKLGIFDLEKD